MSNESSIPPSSRLSLLLLAAFLLVLATLQFAPHHLTEEAPEISYLINVNTATAGELCALPGVGRATAERIVAMRKHLGRFDRPEDLGKVPGLGIKTYERLSPHIKVR